MRPQLKNRVMEKHTTDLITEIHVLKICCYLQLIFFATQINLHLVTKFPNSKAEFIRRA